MNRAVRAEDEPPDVESGKPDDAPPSAASSVAPSAGPAEPVVIESRDWRSYFVSKLTGKGLEIGPLHEPLPKSARADVVYLDRLPLADLAKHYPELPSEKLVDPDIIDDAETLRTIPDDGYDFVSAAHVIEHMRNPIGALENWIRVLKPAGLLYLVVPDKRATFDRTRPQTPLEHMMFDYYAPSKERDREHFLEYAVEVDGKRGKVALESAEYLANLDYSIHFHVFLPSDIMKLLAWFSENIRPIEVLEGPVTAPGSIEFHLMLRKQ